MIALTNPRLAGVCLLALLASCSSTEGLRVTGSGMIGSVTDLQIGELDTDEDLFYGGSLSVRTKSKDFPNFEPGVRIDGHYRQIEDTQPGVAIDYEAINFAVAPFLRYSFPVGGVVTPFLQAHVGYHHTWGDLRLSGGGLAFDGDDDGGGLWFGGTAGIEIKMSDEISFEGGGEYTWLDYSILKREMDEERVGVFFGVTFTF